MVTLFLAQVLGWYLVVFSLLLILKQKQLLPVIADVLEHKGMFFILALFTLIIGLLLVLSHNIWVLAWPVVITVLCWLILVSGLFRLFFLETAMSAAKSMISHPRRVYVMGAIFLIIGLFLLMHAYHVIF